MDVNPYIDINQLFFDLIIFGIFIFFGASEFKKIQNAGFLHFWQGMTIGFLIYSQAVLLFALFQLGYHAWDPTLVAQYQTDTLKFLAERSDLFIGKFGEEAYTTQQELIKETTLGSIVWQSVFKKIGVGFFVSPLISILLRKKPIN